MPIEAKPQIERPYLHLVAGIFPDAREENIARRLARIMGISRGSVTDVSADDSSGTRTALLFGREAIVAASSRSPQIILESVGYDIKVRRFPDQTCNISARGASHEDLQRLEDELERARKRSLRNVAGGILKTLWEIGSEDKAVFNYGDR